MKNWSHMKTAAGSLVPSTQPIPIQDPLPVFKMPEFIPASLTVESTGYFECVSCPARCSILYEGSSYCRSCLKEKQRLGR